MSIQLLTNELKPVYYFDNKKTYESIVETQINDKASITISYDITDTKLIKLLKNKKNSYIYVNQDLNVDYLNTDYANEMIFKIDTVEYTDEILITGVDLLTEVLKGVSVDAFSYPEKDSVALYVAVTNGLNMLSDLLIVNTTNVSPKYNSAKDIFYDYMDGLEFVKYISNKYNVSYYTKLTRDNKFVLVFKNDNYSNEMSTSGRFVHGFNAESVGFLEDTTNRYTGARGFGKKPEGSLSVRLDFKNIVTSYTKKGDDFLSIPDLVADDPFFIKGKDKLKTYVFDGIEDAQELYNETLNKFTEEVINQDKKTFNAHLVDIEKYIKKYNLELFDYITIKRKDIDLVYVTKILGFTINLLNPELSSATFGNVMYQTTAKRVNELKKVVDKVTDDGKGGNTNTGGSSGNGGNVDLSDIYKRLDAINTRDDEQDRRLDEHDRRLDGLDSEVIRLKGDIRNLDGRVKQLEDGTKPPIDPDPNPDPDPDPEEQDVGYFKIYYIKADFDKGIMTPVCRGLTSIGRQVYNSGTYNDLKIPTKDYQGNTIKKLGSFSNMCDEKGVAISSYDRDNYNFENLFVKNKFIIPNTIEEISKLCGEMPSFSGVDYVPERYIHAKSIEIRNVDGTNTIGLKKIYAFAFSKFKIETRQLILPQATINISDAYSLVRNSFIDKVYVSERTANISGINYKSNAGEYIKEPVAGTAIYIPYNKGVQYGEYIVDFIEGGSKAVIHGFTDRYVTRENVFIPSSLRESPNVVVSNSCFSRNKFVKKIEMNNSQDFFQEAMFEFTPNLVEIYYPPMLENLEPYTFRGSKVMILRPYSGITRLLSFGESSFRNFEGTSLLYESDIIKTFGDNVFRDSSLRNIRINDNIEKVPTGMFQNSKNLEQVPVLRKETNTVKRLEDDAFNGTKAKGDIHFGNEITYVGTRALATGNLDSITFHPTVDDNYILFRERALENTGAKVIKLPDVYNESSSGDYIFLNNKRVTSYQIPYRWNTIKKGMFEGSDSLEKVEFFTNGELKIGNSAFQFCPNITELVFNMNGVYNIESLAFRASTKLTSVTLPKGSTVSRDSFPSTTTINYV